MPPAPPAIVQYLNLPQAAIPQPAETAGVPQPDTVGRKVGTAGFTNYMHYDQGWAPALAINNKFAVEVHQAQGDNTLWYRVGEIRFDTGQQNIINWFTDGATQYDNGGMPAIALNDKNELLEVHGASSGGGFAPVALYYRRGHLENNVIVWDTPSIEFAAGLAPSVAINDKDEAVIAYGFMNSLYYMSGTISFQPTGLPGYTPPPIPVVMLSQPAKYDNGITPSVAINNRGAVIEVHQSEGADTLWWHSGQMTAQGMARDVRWSDSTQYDQGTHPKVALNNENHLMEIHQGSGEPDGEHDLFIHLNPDESVDIASLLKGDYGVTPGVALNDDPIGGVPQERVIIVYRIDTNLYYQYSIWAAL
jgi:hypothetical protein